MYEIRNFLGQILVAVFCAHIVFGATQEDIDYIGKYLKVRVKVVDNFIDKWKHFKAELILKNVGKAVIGKADWALYFCSVRHIDRPTAEQPDQWDYIQYGVNITHINGCLHRLDPTANFKVIPPDGETNITYLGGLWKVSKTDFMPNWYVASDNKDLVPRTLASTAGESLDFVEDFTEPKQWKRINYLTKAGTLMADRYDPLTPARRHDANDIRDLGRAPSLVIPTPATTEKCSEKTVYLSTNDWVIVVDDSDRAVLSAANFLSEKIGAPVVSESPSMRYIRFFLGSPHVLVDGKRSNSLEAYDLRVNGDKETVAIIANTDTGAFYAVQTLLSLLDDTLVCPELSITDAPRYPYRGMHLDVARNFHSKEYVIKLLEVMAMYKLNKLHLHLTNDEGWRLQIPGLEELTEVGSRRCFDPEEKKCVLSQLGSGPTTMSAGSGRYTVEEYRDILRYATKLHIEVIPEFEMPGHGHAAIVSMKKRYESLLEQGKPDEAEQYLLTDFNDTSKYESGQMFDDNAINPCMESTYNFVRHVVREVVEMHRDLNPLKTFHFGGDQVPNGAWVNSSACQTLKTRLPELKDYDDLRKYFAERVAEITQLHGVTIAAWEEAFFGKNISPFNATQLSNSDVMAYSWDNIWEWGSSSRPHRLANADYKVVMSQATHLHFDHPYEPDPDERGSYWGTRFTDTRKTFGFMPDNLFGNVDVTRMGKKMNEDEFCKPVEGRTECIPLEKPKNIIGMQGHLWSETVRTDEQADYMIFPRLLALAERAWHKASWEDQKDVEIRKAMRKEDWEKFANTLGYRELKRLDKLGVRYRVPQPGAKLSDEDTLSTNVAFPGLKIEYSTNGGQSWTSGNGTNVSEGVQFRTRSADGGRTSRTEGVEFPQSRQICACLTRT